MNAVVAQWIGTRENQEDDYAVRHYPSGTLTVVCDGMGGHSYGAMASRVAAQAFVEHFEADEGMPITERLEEALYYANAQVGQAFEEAGAFGGTTLLAVFVGGGVIWWISVGDSPLYLWRQGRLLRLNADHSLREVYMEYVREGCMNFADAVMRGHALRSAITGAEIEMVDVSATPSPLIPGDRVMLTTDGTDDLLYVQALSDSVKKLLNDREKNLAVSVVEACQELGMPNGRCAGLEWLPRLIFTLFRFLAGANCRFNLFALPALPVWGCARWYMLIFSA